MGDHTDTAPARARWQVWASGVAAIVVCVGLGLYLTHDRHSSRTSSDAYQRYAGHRWYLQLATSSPGYIELGDAGVFKSYDTEAEFFGTYAIAGNGRLSIRWTGGSTGTPNFDQTVVDALAPLEGDFTEKINKMDKTMTITPMSGRGFSLNVEGHVLAFADRPDPPSSIPDPGPPLVGPAALSYPLRTGLPGTDHTTSGAAWAENAPGASPCLWTKYTSVYSVHRKCRQPSAHTGTRRGHAFARVHK